MIGHLISLLVLFSSSSALEPAIYDGSSWHALPKQVASDRIPLPPISSNWQDKKTDIFVAVSQFKDSKRCADTLRDIFNKASEPGIMSIC